MDENEIKTKLFAMLSEAKEHTEKIEGLAKELACLANSKCTDSGDVIMSLATALGVSIGVYAKSKEVVSEAVIDLIPMINHVAKHSAQQSAAEGTAPEKSAEQPKMKLAIPVPGVGHA